MDPNVRLCVDQRELLSSPGSYRRLVRQLKYLTITRPNIAFAVSVVSQFMLASRSTHLEAGRFEDYEVTQGQGPSWS